MWKCLALTKMSKKRKTDSRPLCGQKPVFFYNLSNMLSLKKWSAYPSLFSTFTACAIMTATMANVIKNTIIFLPFLSINTY